MNKIDHEPKRLSLEDAVLELPIQTLEVAGFMQTGRVLDVKEMLPMLENNRDSATEKWQKLPQEIEGAIVDESLLVSLKNTYVHHRPLVYEENGQDMLWVPQGNYSSPIKKGDCLIWPAAEDRPNGPYIYRQGQDQADAHNKFQQEYRFTSEAKTNHEGFSPIESLEGLFSIVLRVTEKMGTVILANNSWGNGPTQTLTAGDVIRFKPNGPENDFYGISKADHGNYDQVVSSSSNSKTVHGVSASVEKTIRKSELLKLRSDLEAREGKSLGEKAALIQATNRLKHVILDFFISEENSDYPHEIPNLEPPLSELAPQIAEKKASRLQHFLDGGSGYEFDERILESLITSSYEEAYDKQAVVTKTLVKSPVESVAHMLPKIETDINALLPELRFTAEGLLHHLIAIKAEVKDDNLLKGLWGDAVKELHDILSVYTSKEGVPYLNTNLAIQTAVEFFDIYERSKEERPSLYHSDRYEYYFYYLLNKRDHITIPVSTMLGATDLLKMRSVPIGLIGANIANERVDGYLQTPYEFFQHDVNHSRRMYQFSKERRDEHKLDLLEDAEASRSFLEDIVLPALRTKGKNDPLAETKRMARMLFFEVFHEDALPANKDVLIKALFRPELIRTPFEHIEDETNTVHYVMEEGATTLAYLFRKMKHDFYDTPESRFSFLADEEARSRYGVIMAAMYVLKVVSPELCEAPDIQATLEQLVATDEGFPEAYFSTVLDDIDARIASDHSFDMLVSKPVSPQAAVEQIKSSGKQVISLFGFADLGYDDYADLEQKVRAKLLTYNTENHLILIGATDVGIGKMYSIAKEMGFETKGIVSTKSLAYEGSFSPKVDEIYFIKDKTWGGYGEYGELTPTAITFMDASDEVHAFGGGDITAMALNEAIKRSMPVFFTDMKPANGTDTPARDFWRNRP